MYDVDLKFDFEPEIFLVEHAGNNQRKIWNQDCWKRRKGNKIMDFSDFGKSQEQKNSPPQICCLD